MYNSVIDLQKIQDEFKGPIARIAITGMSADISKLLTRFRKITASIKSGNEANLTKVIQQESKQSLLKKVINEFIIEELNRQK